MEESAKGPQVKLSRRSEELVRKLFELEVPEIADGLVEIRQVARETGYRGRDGKPVPGRCKIAVISHADGVDPVGACVGPRGSRVRMVVSELRGERIDIIPYNEDAARFVAKALSPARVREVIVDDEEKTATIIVPDDQLSLAIGKEGQNARLASKLTGWRIDIKSQQQMAEAENSLEFGDEEGVDGQCMAIMRTGKRCPNQAEPGSKYCSIHADYVPAEPAAEKAVEAAPEEAGAPAETTEAARSDRRGDAGENVCRLSPQARPGRARAARAPRTGESSRRDPEHPAGAPICVQKRTVSRPRRRGARSRAPSAAR